MNLLEMRARRAIFFRIYLKYRYVFFHIINLLRYVKDSFQDIPLLVGTTSGFLSSAS